MEKTFQTGSFSFRLKFPEELVLPVDMEKFLVETDSVDYTYIITAVNIVPEAEGELIEMCIRDRYGAASSCTEGKSVG